MVPSVGSRPDAMLVWLEEVCAVSDLREFRLTNPASLKHLLHLYVARVVAQRRPDGGPCAHLVRRPAHILGCGGSVYLENTDYAILAFNVP
jgi:hypothetical protein